MVKQYEVYWANLDPTRGSEVRKIRPCVIISPDDMNSNLSTVIVAPVTSTIRHTYPYRAHCKIAGKKAAIMLDQIRTVDISRIGNRLDTLQTRVINDVKSIIERMLIL